MAQGSYRLAESHRRAQSRLAAETANMLRVTWPLLDLTNLDGTEARWLRTTVPIIATQSNRSARMAADYIVAARTLDLGLDSSYIPVTVRPDPEQIATSLHVTGPVEVRRQTAAGRALLEIRRNVFVTMARSGERLALQGGRGSISASVAADARALGWARVGSGKSCSFCSALISRGPVYGEQSADFDAHDGCHCSAQAVYRRRDAWSPQARQYQELWAESTQGQSGPDALRAFRRAIEAA